MGTEMTAHIRCLLFSAWVPRGGFNYIIIIISIHSEINLSSFCVVIFFVVLMQNVSLSVWWGSLPWTVFCYINRTKCVKLNESLCKITCNIVYNSIVFFSIFWIQSPLIVQDNIPNTTICATIFLILLLQWKSCLFSKNILQSGNENVICIYIYIQWTLGFYIYI